MFFNRLRCSLHRAATQTGPIAGRKETEAASNISRDQGCVCAQGSLHCRKLTRISWALTFMWRLKHIRELNVSQFFWSQFGACIDVSGYRETGVKGRDRHSKHSRSPSGDPATWQAVHSASHNHLHNLAVIMGRAVQQAIWRAWSF